MGRKEIICGEKKIILTCDDDVLFKDIIRQVIFEQDKVNVPVINFNIGEKKNIDIDTIVWKMEKIMETDIKVENLFFRANYYVSKDKKVIQYGSEVVIIIEEDINVWYKKSFLNEYHSIYTPYIMFTSILYEYEAILGKTILHASGVTFCGKGLILLGKKGSGKSTLALNLAAQHGFSYLADDKVIFDSDQQIIYSMPDVIRLNPDVYFKLHYIPDTNIEKKIDSKNVLNVSQLPIKRASKSEPLLIILPLINREKENYFCVHEISRTAALGEFLEHRIVAFEESEKIVVDIQNLLTKCPIMIIELGRDIETNCQAIKNLFFEQLKRKSVVDNYGVF